MKRTIALAFVALFVMVLPAAAGEITRLGIYAGTFDPFHQQHLFLAREAADRLHLDKVLIVPNASNLYKPGMLPLDLRYPAIGEALRDTGDPRLELLPRAAIEQADAGGPPESAGARLLAAAAATAPRATVFQILGSDALAKIIAKNGIPKPGQHWILVVKPRAGEPPLDPQVIRPLLRTGVLHLLPPGQVELSSTRVREAAAGGNWAFLRNHLPPAVVRHLVKNGLYGSATAPGWLEALVALGPDPVEFRVTGGAGLLSGVTPPRPGAPCPDFLSAPGLPAPGPDIPELPPDPGPCAIDPAEPHTLGDLRAYVAQRLTPLGMAILGRPEVRVHLVLGPRERVNDLLARFGITRALQVTRARNYITLAVVFGQGQDGTWHAFIGDIYGRSRLLHTEAMTALALRFGNRPPDGFSIVGYPPGVTDATYLREIGRRALAKVPPGRVDLAIVGYHWKVQQQLNLRLAAWQAHPSPWSVLDGRGAAWMARFRPAMRSPQTLPQWPRRHFEGWDLPYSFLFFRDGRGRPATVLLTRNVYGDQLPALLDVLYHDKGIRRFVLFGSAGGLASDTRIGDLVAPSVVSLEPGLYQPLRNHWRPSRLPATVAPPLTPAPGFSVYSPLEETTALVEALRRERARIVDVELGHVPGWLDSLGTAPVVLRSLSVVSDVPGSGRTLERLSEGETELTPAFQAAVDRILQEFDLVAPSDHRIPELDTP
ncbi:MAG: hypothetical protein GX442_14890 [Candidatus Riflebacteria bacterium]|nr:hypothetical protein [Candidatus Riflebacteria bacterium]